MFEIKTTSNGRRPQILKRIYLSNHWSDIFKLLNQSLCDQTKLDKHFKWRWPPMEDDNKGMAQRKTRVWLCSAQLVILLYSSLVILFLVLFIKSYSIRLISLYKVFNIVLISYLYNNKKVVLLGIQNNLNIYSLW